ncbi:uncharacterized protein [Arachis hypogaea]|uniref:uncharacterized protein n=1 Tax=Arachis hypogaea TaxID=3818 RepID=UPI003B20C6A6
MCVDYTDLNKACPKDAFPTKHRRISRRSIRPSIPQLHGRIFVYNQIPMHDRRKTAFITPDGTYCYTVMPFGLKMLEHLSKTCQQDFSGPVENRETLYLYLSITEEALAAALIREDEKKQQKPLPAPATILPSSPRDGPNRPGGQASITETRPSRKNASMVHRVIQFQIKFEPRNAIKAQVLTDFIAEMTPGKLTLEPWKLHVDGSSNSTHGGAGIILKTKIGSQLNSQYDTNFQYQITRQNTRPPSRPDPSPRSRSKGPRGKYDSQVVSSQSTEATRHEIPCSNNTSPRERNARADLLSKLASTKPGHGNKSLIQEVVRSPSVSTTINAHLTSSNRESWTHPILQYLLDGTLPPDPKEEKRIKREAANYTIIAGQLYKRGFSQPLLKYVEHGDTEYILREIHEGCCGHQSEAKH